MLPGAQFRCKSFANLNHQKLMVQLGCCLRQKASSSPLSSLSELSCSASVYPQTSPLVNRLGLSPAVSSFFHLPSPPSLCLMACLFQSEPLPCSSDGIKERGGKKVVDVLYVKRRAWERRDRCLQCRNCFA